MKKFILAMFLGIMGLGNAQPAQATPTANQCFALVDIWQEISAYSYPAQYRITFNGYITGNLPIDNTWEAGIIKTRRIMERLCDNYAHQCDSIQVEMNLHDENGNVADWFLYTLNCSSPSLSHLK